jgi:hypothetical protein
MAFFGTKQTLSQKLQQKLSPQQIQLMKLLQIPTATLEQRIQEELEANPALEEGDETADLLEGSTEMDEAEIDYFAKEEKAPKAMNGCSDGSLDEIDRDTADEYAEEEEAVASAKTMSNWTTTWSILLKTTPVTYKTRGEDRNSDEEEKTIPLAFENTFHEYLEQQLGLLTSKDDREHAIAMQIIGSIDDDGYLRRDSAAMVDDLLFSQNISYRRKGDQPHFKNTTVRPARNRRPRPARMPAAPTRIIACARKRRHDFVRRKTGQSRSPSGSSTSTSTSLPKNTTPNWPPTQPRRGRPESRP